MIMMLLGAEFRKVSLSTTSNNVNMNEEVNTNIIGINAFASGSNINHNQNNINISNNTQNDQYALLALSTGNINDNKRSNSKTNIQRQRSLSHNEIEMLSVMKATWDLRLEEFKRKYILGGDLGRGAFGTVHKALDTTTGKVVAVKEIKKKLTINKEKKSIIYK